MPAEISKFSNTHFRNIPENLSHIFGANLTRFLPEWNIYVSTVKIMEKIIGISRGNSWWRHGLTATQRAFRLYLNLDRRDLVPSRNTILFYVTNFRANGSALKRKSTGRPGTARTPKNVATFVKAVDSVWTTRPCLHQEFPREIPMIFP